jgi:eukaryotic-like serine/threonine-protein kinase
LIVEHEPRLLAERYRLGERVGAGGMGTVYAAFDMRLDRAVAVKLLRADFARDPAARRRFEREARSAARVSHPNAVAVYDTGDDTHHDAFIVMELLSGRTLAHEIADGPLVESRLRAVAGGVLAALEAAHHEGIVHRDVKPGNVLLAEDGEVKVGDFGIATVLDATETTSGVPLGTPAYTAPERLRGLPATPASDLYSLGVVLYEAATGTRPFTGAAPGELVDAVLHGAHRPLDSVRRDLDPSLVAAIERALATDPTDRFAGADSMRTALAGEDMGRGAPTTVPVTEVPAAPTAALPRPVPPRRIGTVEHRGASTPARRPVLSRRRRAAWVMAIVAMLAVLVIVGVALVTSGGDDAATTTTTTTPIAATPTTGPGGPAATGAAPAPISGALHRLEELTKP